MSASPDVRAQAAQDNAAAPGRYAGGPATPVQQSRPTDRYNPA